MKKDNLEDFLLSNSHKSKGPEGHTYSRILNTIDKSNNKKSFLGNILAPLILSALTVGIIGIVTTRQVDQPTYTSTSVAELNEIESYLEGSLLSFDDEYY